MSDSTTSARRRRRWATVVIAGGALCIGSAVGWAASTVLTPAKAAVEATPYTLVSVQSGEVGSSIGLNTVAAWPQVPVGLNRASGVVTGVSVTAGDEVSEGSVVYSVNLRPVTVAEGSVPAFRAIRAGDRGADVAQLQQLLAARAAYGGPADGNATWETVEAIMRWQRSLGVAQTGVVELGDVIFVPRLPSRVVIDRKVISSGASVVGGENAVFGLPAAPVFTLPISDGQRSSIPPGTRVEATSPEGRTWGAIAGEQSTDPETSAASVALEGVDGNPVCGDECAQIQVTGEVLLPSQVIAVDTVEGLVVPSAALVTDAQGELCLISADGERIGVTVKASARGMSVIEGVDEGTEVRVPGEVTDDASG